ncbi:MAG: glycogen synthase GlgA [bacterium]|nr:glycogen synthase GlgA [Candidatus Sumerlaeota bacterium]
MKILLVSSEVVPFAKTGGLADVAGALPIQLAELGHEVAVAMPKYSSIDDDTYALLPILGDIHVRLGTAGTHTAQIKKTSFPGTKVPVYFIQNAEFFDREGLYQQEDADYPDNAVRFAFFSKAVIWLLKGLDWMPDIIHCNDWQTAIIPICMRTQPDMKYDEDLSRIRLLFTVHNLAYQGLFDHTEAARIGLGEHLFHPGALEFYGKLNLMKGALLFSDAITTVSRQYAREIQTPDFGCGLHGVLLFLHNRLHGILNGIDYGVWNPETDNLIPHHYSPEDFSGKVRCKADLQKVCGLDREAETPLIGIISRLDRQKGCDLIVETAQEIADHGAQIVLLGTGVSEYHSALKRIAQGRKGRISVNLKFDNNLAHLIEAGSDMFLMPSRYEPCGLNQLYSLKYGTVPVVRRVGGLADSIIDATSDSVKSGSATGFVFTDYSADAMMSAIERACAMFKNKSAWRKLMTNGMSRDYSWKTSALEYERLYMEIAGMR